MWIKRNNFTKIITNLVNIDKRNGGFEGICSVYIRRIGSKEGKESEQHKQRRVA